MAAGLSEVRLLIRRYLVDGAFNVRQSLEHHVHPALLQGVVVEGHTCVSSRTPLVTMFDNQY